VLKSNLGVLLTGLIGYYFLIAFFGIASQKFFFDMNKSTTITAG